ncbi:hypothetical protein BLAHAN_04010 [Blautia hansenii DSM 20583]|uniref:Uncharacterized protein n=1 Tax=Blautia hansenii DSM 20583 TaxID=537007 RepID=C9L3U3_BLAHA|nr:hypothetical protein BLAHAN_04010 [Blautia hansenii DSM 20583]
MPISVLLLTATIEKRKGGMSYEQYCGKNYGRTSMRNRVQYSDFWWNSGR